MVDGPVDVDALESEPTTPIGGKAEDAMSFDGGRYTGAGRVLASASAAIAASVEAGAGMGRRARSMILCAMGPVVFSESSVVHNVALKLLLTDYVEAGMATLVITRGVVPDL